MEVAEILTVAGGATTLFAAAALGFTLLAALFDAGLLVEAAALELFANAFASHFALEAADRAADVVVLNDDFERAQFIGTACHFVLFIRVQYKSTSHFMFERSHRFDQKQMAR